MDKEIKEILKEVNELLSKQGHFKLIDLERVRNLNSKIENCLLLPKAIRLHNHKL